MNGAIYRVTGRVIKQAGDMLVVFKIMGRYYPAIEFNCDIVDAYWKTGDKNVLRHLKHEVEVGSVV